MVMFIFPVSFAAAAAKSRQLCPTLCDPMDGSPTGSHAPGILQARTLEWVAISFSNAWKWNVKVKSLSRFWLLVTPWTAAHQAPPSTGFARQEYWSGVPLPSLPLTRKSSQFWVPWLHVSINSLKSVMVKVFTPQTLANAMNQGFSSTFFFSFFFFFFFWDCWFAVIPLPWPQKSYITSPGFSFPLCRMGKVEVLPHIQGACFAHSRRHLHTRVCELCFLEWQSAQHCSWGQCGDGMLNTCSCTGA